MDGVPQRIEKVISDERAQQLIDEALGKGSLKQRDIVSTLSGLTGSGKTCLLGRLFGKDPPDLYTSTGLAEKSERGLFHHIGNVSFKLLSDKDILEFLAPLIQAGMTEANVVSLASSLLGTDASTSSPPPSLPSPSSKPQSLPEKSPTSQEMVRLVQEADTSKKEMVLELIHMIDTGGQPEFMERMPCLIHNANLAILVVNLLYGLDERPPVRFHVKGVAYKREMPSQYSTRQMIKKLAATLQAKRSSHKKGSLFQILVVATHRDCVKGDLKARVDALNRELRDSLLPTYRDKLITYSKRQIAFVLNLKDPDDDDKKALELIRSKVSDKSHALGKVIDIPGSFFMYEQDLLKYAAKKERGVLSLKECLDVGARLKMKDEVVQAALVFFHRNNTFLYFREVLPNLVFVRPQVPLEFVNAVVLFSYKISDGCTHGFLVDIADSLENGIITEEMLNRDEFSACFVPGLYEPRQAIELSCYTFTLAPLSHKKWSEPSTKSPQPITVADSKKDRYLMMCLLPPIPGEDLCQYIPSSSKMVPLVVRFTDDSVPLGCFGSIISCLLSLYNWDILRNDDDDSPECLAHNIAMLVCPTPTVYLKVVLVDTADYIEVHVNKSENLPQVRKEIFGAITKVFDIMCITDSEIEVSPAFLCPCKEVGLPHTASLDEVDSKQYLDCSKKKWKGEAQDKYTMWFGDKLPQTGKRPRQLATEDEEDPKKKHLREKPSTSHKSGEHTSPPVRRKGKRPSNEYLSPSVKRKRKRPLAMIPEPTSKDLMNLVKTDKPIKLGLQLDVAECDLDIVKINHPNDHAQQLSDVLSLYMRQSLDPSWMEVTTALWNIGERNRAKTIADEYGFPLPIQPAVSTPGPSSSLHEPTFGEDDTSGEDNFR